MMMIARRLIPSFPSAVDIAIITNMICEAFKIDIVNKYCNAIIFLKGYNMIPHITTLYRRRTSRHDEFKLD